MEEREVVCKWVEEHAYMVTGLCWTHDEPSIIPMVKQDMLAFLPVCANYHFTTAC